jgi:hypothetical protein
VFGNNSNLFCYKDGTWTWSDNNPTTYYPNIDIAHSNVKADDYEVFQVVKE